MAHFRNGDELSDWLSKFWVESSACGFGEPDGGTKQSYSALRALISLLLDQSESERAAFIQMLRSKTCDRAATKNERDQELDEFFDPHATD